MEEKQGDGGTQRVVAVEFVGEEKDGDGRRVVFRGVREDWDVVWIVEILRRRGERVGCGCCWYICQT